MDNNGLKANETNRHRHENLAVLALQVLAQTGKHYKTAFGIKNISYSDILRLSNNLILSIIVTCRLILGVFSREYMFYLLLFEDNT